MGRRSAILLLGFLSILVPALGVVPAQAFPDVPPDHPYARAIDALAADGIIAGYEDGAFGVNDTVVRQQFAKMIVLSLGLVATEADVSPFEDVADSGPDGLYPDNYVAVAAREGITRGTDSGGTPLFRPLDPIPRAQVLTMVVRAVERLHPGTLAAPPSGFGTQPDFSPDHAPSLTSAEFNLMLTGLVGFGPFWNAWAPASRGEVADILWRMRHLVAGAHGAATPQEVDRDIMDNGRLDGSYTRKELLGLLGDSNLRSWENPRVFWVADYLLHDHPRIGRIVFDGDSMTAGSNATNPYPSQLMAGWPRTIPWRNLGIGGLPLFEMVAHASARVDSFCPDGRGKNVVVIWGGTNDMALWDNSVVDVAANLRTYALARHERGFRVVVLTTLPRSDSKAPWSFESRRHELNNWIRACWPGFADELVDVAADDRLGWDGAERGRAYYTADRVHLNNTGLGVAAGIVRAGLLKMEERTGPPVMADAR